MTKTKQVIIRYVLRWIGVIIVGVSGYGLVVWSSSQITDALLFQGFIIFFFGGIVCFIMGRLVTPLVQWGFFKRKSGTKGLVKLLDRYALLLFFPPW